MTRLTMTGDNWSTCDA